MILVVRVCLAPLDLSPYASTESDDLPISPAGAEHTNIRIRQFRIPAQARRPTTKPPVKKTDFTKGIYFPHSSL